MTDHTPTPWALVGKGDIKSVCKGFPEAMVAKVLGQPTKAERTANGAFLVTAVNNHDALRAALENLCHATFVGGLTDTNTSAFLDAKRALGSLDRVGTSGDRS